MTVEKATFDILRINEVPYTVIPTKVIKHNKSAEAFSVWSYLQSLPSKWEVCKDHIKKVFGYCRKKINEIFSYLNRSKLLEYRRNRNPDGTLSSVEIVVLNGLDFDINEPYNVNNSHKKEYKPIINIYHNGKKIVSRCSLNILEFPPRGEELLNNIPDFATGTIYDPVDKIASYNCTNNTTGSQNRTSGHLFILKKQYSEFREFSISLKPVDNSKMDNGLKPTDFFSPEQKAIDLCSQKGLDIKIIKKKFVDYFSQKGIYQSASNFSLQKMFIRWIEREKDQKQTKKTITPTHSTVKFWDKNQDTAPNLHILEFGPGNPDYDMLMAPKEKVYIRPSKRALNK